MKERKKQLTQPVERARTKRPERPVTQRTVSPPQTRTSAERAGGDPGSLLAMQRSLGNRAVQRMLDRAIKADGHKDNREISHLLATPVAVIQRANGGARVRAVPRRDYVFIMGRDPLRCRRVRGRRRCRRTGFYAMATGYYRSQLPNAVLIQNRRNLTSVLNYLRTLRRPVGRLYLVSHANQDGSLSFPLSAGDWDRRISYAELRDAIRGLPQLPKHVIDRYTTIHIKGCNIGRAQRMLELVDRAFGGYGTVAAPTHKQIFGVRSGRRYEAFKGYFIERRGSVRLRARRLYAGFMAKYPHLTLRRLRRWRRRIRHSVSSRTYTAFDAWLPTRRQANRRAVKRRWFGRRGHTVINNQRHRVRRLQSYRTQRAGAFVTHIYTFRTRQVGGRRTGWAYVSIRVPTDRRARANAENWAQTALARPEMYGWRVVRRRRGLRRIIRVVGRMTEYTIRAQFTLPQGAREETYFGRSRFTPRGR